MKIEGKDICVGLALVRTFRLCPIFVPFCFFREDGMVEQEIRGAGTLMDVMFRAHHIPPCLKFDIDIIDGGQEKIICDIRKLSDSLFTDNPLVFEFMRECSMFDRRMKENVEPMELQLFLQAVIFGIGSIFSVFSSVGDKALVVPEEIINNRHKYSPDELKAEVASYGDFGKGLFAFLEGLTEAEKANVLIIIKMFIETTGEYLAEKEKFEKFLGDIKIEGI